MKGTDESAEPSEGTDEALQYAVVPDGAGGTVTVSASTTDDEGIRTQDSDEVEVEVPREGVLIIEIESDEVELVPNFVGGNPRVGGQE